ncbi:MAG: hypothetical protein LBE38_05920 [Deltaproteobacteria bacterium]|jgi:two-component system phosphate regulon sensor histidine kinase PhoR|nr:hypothetical protein [Deltaproteobacteria bacterium]
MIDKYKLFILVFLPAALVLILGLALVQSKNKTISSEQFASQLKNQWLLVSIIEDHALGSEDFQAITKHMGLRVTLVAKDGKVLHDTGTPSGEVLEDHSQREEIRNAFLGHPSMAVRQSRTTGLYTIYYAEKLDEDRVLRVAYPAQYFQETQSALLAQTTSGLLILLFAVFVFALLVSRKASKTLTELSYAVTMAKNGNTLLPSFNSEHLDSALFALAQTTNNLKSSLDENSRLNARLQYILARIQEGVVLLLNKEQIIYKNERASEILNYQLPEKTGEITSAEILAFFQSFSTTNPDKELKIQDRIITFDLEIADPYTLIILHDITDREKYLGYKSNLVANISHELKTPLSIIITTSEVISKDTDIPPEILHKFLKTIHMNSKRLSMLLDDLISLHRLETREAMELNEVSDIVPTNLAETLEDVMDMIDPGDKKITFSGETGLVNINPWHILSLLTNLITNAVKYSKEPDIEVTINKKGPSVEIAVADGGPLIPLQERERIFERFYSLSESRNRELSGSGSGLGLSIVKHIAKIYGGEAQVKENSRKGNTFTVRLTEKQS